MFTSSSNHDVHSLIVNLSKPLVYEDPSINKVETPQMVEALQVELMAMSGPRCPEVGFDPNQEIVQTLKVPHYSSLSTQYQSNTQVFLPPLELYDPIAHALEDESYLFFSCLLTCHSQECDFASKLHFMSHNTMMSPWTSCHACTHLCPMGTLKHEVWFSSLLYLSRSLVQTIGFLMDQAFTNMGLLMH